jgi:hypothetical protein
VLRVGEVAGDLVHAVGEALESTVEMSLSVWRAMK